ncbi:MAG: glycerophosphodiester phosphodiesterase, partial [Actinomycetota bacterium]|nr:glycerophosphodiester phosphodiesterase [Actinomycetota bacterium]
MGPAPRTYQPGEVLVVAHRGASEDAPEHTTHAYDAALAQGADSIEVDLRLTRDGVLVCWHDETLERIAGMSAAVGDLTLDELRGLDVGSWFNRAHPERARPQFVGAQVVTFAQQLERQ